MCRHLFLYVLILTGFSSAWGQYEDIPPGHQNLLEVGIGYTQLYTKDLNFSPLNYSGNGFVYNLAYERRSKSDRHLLSMSAAFSSDYLQTPTPNTIDPLYIYADIGISFNTQIFPSEQRKAKYYLGGAYNTRAFYIDYDDQEAFSYTATHGLSVLGILEYQINVKNKFRTSLSIPIVQLLARPPYNGIDAFIIENQDNVEQILFFGKVASFNHYRAVFWKTDYRYSVCRFLDVGLRYHLGYQTATEPVKSVLWQHQVSTFLGLKF
ncbi:MAG: hypothetical protein WBG48_14600 [Pricia sp.]